MFLISSPTGALSARKCSLKSTAPIQPIYSNSATHRRPKFIPSRNSRKPLYLTLAKAEGGLDSNTAPKQPSPPPPPFNIDDTVFVGQEDVPLEGVIQFEKPSSSSRLIKWGRVALLAGGDVLALLLFSAIGRYNHGLPIFAMDTIRTADPFMAGWFLSAYFLGGYGEDGRGANALSKAVIAAAKSWGLGIPLGLIIRAATSGHIPQYTFVLVTMGSTSVLLIGWRALLISIFPDETKKKNDVYRRGSPFELFELLTSLETEADFIIVLKSNWLSAADAGRVVPECLADCYTRVHDIVGYALKICLLPNSIACLAACMKRGRNPFVE